MPANIYIIEDHPLMQKMIKQFLSRLTSLTICGTAGSAQEALAQIPGDIDIALVDVSLPDMNGIMLVSELKALYPQLYCLMLSGHQESTYAQRALAAGASGYVTKGNPIELANAIEQVLAGDVYLSEGVR